MENNKHLQNELTNSITAVYDGLTSALEQFGDDQINIVPFEGSWTPGQVIDHVIKATGGIPDGHVSPAERRYDEKVKQMESVFLDFSTKMKSPDFVLPGNGPFIKKELIRQLQILRSAHLNKILHTDLTALCLDFELRPFGPMTRYEWFRFLIAHGKRHLHQLSDMLAVA